MNFSNFNNTSYMFFDCPALERIEGDRINLNNAVSTSYMFEDCFLLKYIEIVGFANTENMNSMFRDCKSLQKVILTSMDSVDDLSYLFNTCDSLQEVTFPEITQPAYFFGLVSSSSILKIKNLRVLEGSTDVHLYGGFLQRLENCYFEESFNIGSNSFGRYGFIEVFESLQDRSALTSKDVNITNSSIDFSLAPWDVGIAYSKNWTITGLKDETNLIFENTGDSLVLDGTGEHTIVYGP